MPLRIGKPALDVKERFLVLVAFFVYLLLFSFNARPVGNRNDID